MTAGPSLHDAASRLRDTFAGQLLREGESGYDESRRVHNGLVDKRPALIARCRGVADVVDAVHLARDHGAEVSVRGGGHNVAGRAVVERGLMIDLSLMKGIHVNPKERTVRAQGGVTWGQLNRDTQVYGLATTGGIVSSTGVAGLTLGGGLGYLMGKYGLVVDNLLSAEIVMADGLGTSGQKQKTRTRSYSGFRTKGGDRGKRPRHPFLFLVLQDKLSIGQHD